MSDTGRPARRARVGRTGARFPAFVDFDEPADADDAGATGRSEGADGADRADRTDGSGGSAGSGGTLPRVPEPRKPAGTGAVEPESRFAFESETETESEFASESAAVGRTGARFNSRARRDRRDRRDRRAAARDAAVRAAARENTVAPPGRHVLAPDDAPTHPIFLPTPTEPSPDERSWVRPYVRTQGRTRSRITLAIETLVSLPDPDAVIVDPEHLGIAEICDEPRSVAEVAARLRVPLGVARVLIDDMVGAGLLVVHELAVRRSGAPDPAIMKRVLDGLHRL